MTINNLIHAALRETASISETRAALLRAHRYGMVSRQEYVKLDRTILTQGTIPGKRIA